MESKIWAVILERRKYNILTKPITYQRRGSGRKESMLPKELSDKYHILKLIHHGIGGEVLLVEHKTLACRRIIKTVNKAHPQYGSLVREAKLLQQFHHPSIPIIYDIFEYDTATYLIEEFIEGETLRQYLLRQRSLSESLLLNFSEQLCEILHYIHSPAHRVLHLDLKPENLLITDCNIKLIDFGSAICRNQEEPIGAFFGSPGFCAPEQETAGILSEQTDIYGLGRLLEYMLFYAKKSPKGFYDIVKNCLRKGEKTYTSAEQVKQDIERLSRRRHKSEQPPTGRWFAVTGIPTAYHSMALAASLAAYFGKHGKRVLFLSCNRVRTRLERESEQQGFVYEQNGITVAERIAPQEVKGWRGRGYDYIVCDLGADTFDAAGIPFDLWLCVGSMSEWTELLWHQALDELLPLQKAVVLVTEGDIALAVREFGRKCAVGQLALHSPVFTCSKESRKLFKSLL
ncbi:MAG: serine/threonine protein kinase [Lachnospiraceae bacterium]